MPLITRPRTATLLLVFVALLKIGVFLIAADQDAVAPFVGDNAVAHYLPTAKRLLEQRSFNGPDSRPDSKVPPGYPVILAATMAVSPDNYVAVTVALQILADCVTALVLYVLGRRLISPAVGLFAGLLWSLYPPAVVISTWITAETFYTTILILSYAMLVFSYRNGSTLQSTAAGFLLGLATLFRGTAILLPLLLLPLWFRKRQYAQAAGFVLAATCVVAPWTIRNAVVLQDHILVSTGFGSVLMQGSDESVFTSAGKRSEYARMFSEAAEHGIYKPTTPLESQWDNWMGRVGLYNLTVRLKTRPLSFLPFYVTKFLRLWYATESASLRPELLLGLCSILVVPVGILQLFLWRSSHSEFAQSAGVVILYFVALPLVTLPLVRYTLPIYPILILSASGWWLAVANRLTSRPVGEVVHEEAVAEGEDVGSSHQRQ
jgi:4-amino-4-deoxy-L-arabinose transferase-like glycosyltransferase